MSIHFPSTRFITRSLAGGALACVTAGAVLAGPTTFAASQARGHAAASQWLKWNAKTHTASLTLTAAYNNALQGFNFNGYGNGKLAVTVPVGARVKVTFTNKAAGVTHSFVITPYKDRNSASSFPVAFAGASSPDASAGTAKGKTIRASFVAKKAGKYAIVCAVPGHVPAGMWDVFQVRKAASATIVAR
jgi:sulfocyanin